ncbi:unnamed protein product [Ectocarpus sp. 6 AP-2014]
MSSKFAKNVLSGLSSAATTAGRKASVPTTAGKKIDLSSLKKTDASALKKTDASAFKKTDASALKKTDASKAGDQLDAIKKLETDSFTKQFGDTVKKSSFYKKNQKKLLAAGLTLGATAAWYGTLLAQGFSPAEAWDKMTSDLADIVTTAATSVLVNLWQTFVVLVHNFAGKHLFEDTTTTDMALRFLIGFIVIVRFFSLFGINLFSLLFGLIFRRKAR